MLLCVLCCLSTVSTYTEKVMVRNVLEILMPSLDSVNIYSI